MEACSAWTGLHDTVSRRAAPIIATDTTQLLRHRDGDMVETRPIQSQGFSRDWLSLLIRARLSPARFFKTLPLGAHFSAGRVSESEDQESDSLAHFMY